MSALPTNFRIVPQALLNSSSFIINHSLNKFMNIQIIALGKLKEKYLTDAVREYEKRISGFAKFSITELEPERLSDNPSDGEIAAALDSEAEKIMAKFPQNSMIVAMCIEGKQFGSETFAKKINEAAVNGKSNIVFIIGSSHGLSDKIKKAAQLKMSMSEMTFPHQLARIMLAEQIYRAFTIINNRKYHK